MKLFELRRRKRKSHLPLQQARNQASIRYRKSQLAAIPQSQLQSTREVSSRDGDRRAWRLARAEKQSSLKLGLLQSSNARLRAYILLLMAGSVTFALLAYRRNDRAGWLAASISAIAAAIKRIQTYDLGNVIAAGIAMTGYLIENWFSRKATQMEKRMERVEAQSHELLVPVTMHWQRLWMGSLLGFIDKHFADVMENEGFTDFLIRYQEWLDNLPKHMEETPNNLNHPESFAMLSEVMFERTTTPQNTVRVKTRVTSKHELPLMLHNEIQWCDRESKLWKSYEAFVRHSFVPVVERIASIIDEHGHLMEPVPPGRMEELFGTDGTGYGIKWSVAPRGWFYSHFLSYASSWQELLSMWDGGVYEEIRPSVDFPVGLMFFNVEAQSIVAEVEKELIGASQMHGHKR